jgi:hypothetical protein
MKQKIEILREYMVAGDWRAALKLAASWPSLGAHATAIRQGWEAYARPDFQRQLGRDVDSLIAAGREALQSRYGAC